MLTFGARGQVEARACGSRCPRRGSGPRRSSRHDLHAGGVPAVAVHLRPRGRDRASRAPDLDPHRRASSPPFVARGGQKRIIAPEDPSSEATIGKALDSISCSSPLAERIRNTAWAGRPLRTAWVAGRSSSGDRLAVVAEGPVGGGPLLGAHAPRVLERAPEQGAGGLVVEDQRAVLVDQERGRRDARQQVAGQDQLQGFLGASRHRRPFFHPRVNRHQPGAAALGCTRMRRRAWSDRIGGCSRR